TGLQYGHSTRSAILLSALLFGFLHVLLSLFQQLFNATLLGIVLGLLAVRSGSILPGIVFHVLNNGLAVVMGHWVSDPSGRRIASPLPLSARYVLPVEGPPVADACLTIEAGRVAWIGPASERRADLDLGNVAITPGFVNAHTHLELDSLEGSGGAGEPPVEDEV